MFSTINSPKPRARVYDTYWYLAAERQRIFHARARGQSSPWTKDPVLARYKFCNAYRASDRVSQYLIARCIYAQEAVDLSPEDVFARIILFRIFSKPETWEALETAVGPITRQTLNVNEAALGDALEDLMGRGQSVYTSAFILASTSVYGHARKHRNHLELVRRMFAPKALGLDLARANSLEEVYQALRQWPTIGPFMGYQIAVDLNYSPYLNFSENDFTVPGPGAVRGLNKVFSETNGATPAQLIQYMVEHQEQEFSRLNLDWQDLFGRRLHAIDCQGLFCETDKYSRVAFPELKSNRTRIKAEFAPSPTALPLFYPPKWGLNDKLPAAKPNP